MSNSRDYYHSSSRSSRRNDCDDLKQEDGRLPPVRYLVGDASAPRNPSPYNFHDVERSLPSTTYNSQSGYDTKHGYSQRGPTLAPIHSESTAHYGAHSTHSGSSHISSRYGHSGMPPTSSSSRANADYPLNHGHSFQAFYAAGDGLVPISGPATRPQGMVRSCDIPSEDYDPKKRYQCSQCPKRFDRPSGLQTHELRHTGDKPHLCPICDKPFSVKSNMSRHVREQHREDVDQDDGHYSTYSGTSRASSDKSSTPYYSSARRK